MQFFFINTAGFLLQSLIEKSDNKVITLEVTLSEGTFNLNEYEQINNYKLKRFESFDKLTNYVSIEYGNNNLEDFKRIANIKLIAHKDYFFNTVLPLRNKRIHGGD
jgi:hypothetical protein